jgi:N-acetyl-gamma-glutamyl-phosphate reductase
LAAEQKLGNAVRYFVEYYPPTVAGFSVSICMSGGGVTGGASAVVRVGIVGATGYGGRELIRLLGGHSEAELVAVASTSVAGQPLGEVLPAFRKQSKLVFEAFDAASLAGRCDVVFLAVPSTQSMETGAALRGAGARVIDIGPDFRLKDKEVFARHYNTQHVAPDLLGESVYGLAPWYREGLKEAGLVAGPGCYCIGSILPLRPLVQAVTLDTPVVIDAISGVTGAGRTPSETYHFPEMNENLRAYNIGKHRHTPEIEQELGYKAMVQFTPHVAPLGRGILSTITVRLSETVDMAEVYSCYDDEPFVRILPEGVTPDIGPVRATNYCDIGWVMDTRTGNLIIVSAIDNLCGGTAGMALQCMNIMFGMDETLGLGSGGMAP